MTAPSLNPEPAPRDALSAPQSASTGECGAREGRDAQRGSQGPSRASLGSEAGSAARDGAATEHEFLVRVLKIFSDADAHNDLHWWVRDDGPHMYANVSDVFAWGGADAEDITPDTLPVLEQAFTDLKAIGEEHLVGELYVARIRHQRPQGAAYPDTAAAQALFNACGPERPLGLGNPKPIPAAKETP